MLSPILRGVNVGAFYTDKQGRIRPITGKSSKKGAGFVTATVLAGAVAVSSGGLGGTASVGGAANPALSEAVQARTISAKQAARKGQRTKAWKRMRLKVARKTVKRNTNCFQNSYGQVQEFFARNSCRSLRRVLLTVSDEHSNTAMLSIYWVRLSSTSSAYQFNQLVDIQGTGNISPLGHGALKAQGISFTGRYYDSRQARSLVVIAEAAPANGYPNADLLEGATRVAAQLPPP